MKKLFVTGFIFVSLIGLYVMAQSSPAPVASATPAVVAAVPVAHSSLSALVDSKGGLVPFLLLIMWSANSFLTAIRGVLLKWDNIAPGDAVPESNKPLTFVNKVSAIIGKILDFMMANPQH